MKALKNAQKNDSGAISFWQEGQFIGSALTSTRGSIVAGGKILQTILKFLNRLPLPTIVCNNPAHTAIKQFVRPSRTELAGAPDELAPTRASLLARLKDVADDDSWLQFFETYHRLIYAAVVRRGLPPQDAEDVVMEIVEGVAKRMPEFVYDPQRCSFKTWLFRIVANRVADHRRQRMRTVQREEAATDDLPEIADPMVVEPGKEWQQAWEENLIRTALERVRRRANARYMQLYLYSEVEGHSVQETARHLQTTENDVSVARHRIRQMLREEGQRLLKEEQQREQGIR